MRPTERADFINRIRTRKVPAATNRKSGMAYEAVFGFVASIVGRPKMGGFLDTYFGTARLLLVGGVIFGTIAGFYQFYRLISRLE